VTVIADDKKYTSKSEIRDGNVSPIIHIVLTCPKGKTELLSKFEQLGEHEYTGKFKPISAERSFFLIKLH